MLKRKAHDKEYTSLHFKSSNAPLLHESSVQVAETQSWLVEGMPQHSLAHTVKSSTWSWSICVISQLCFNFAFQNVLNLCSSSCHLSIFYAHSLTLSHGGHPLYQQWCGSIVQENTVAATCALMADINRTDCVMMMMWRYAKWPLWRAYWCHSMTPASTRVRFGSYHVNFIIKRWGSGGTSAQRIYITINQLCLRPSSRLQRSVTGMTTRLSGLQVYLSISTTGYNLGFSLAGVGWVRGSLC